jgi:signal transduction histidine kinase
MEKRNQSTQIQRVDDALEAQRVTEHFIDMVSHELRNPMSAMLQSADIIASTSHDVVGKWPALSPCFHKLTSIFSRGREPSCTRPSSAMSHHLRRLRSDDSLRTAPKEDSGRCKGLQPCLEIRQLIAE